MSRNNKYLISNPKLNSLKTHRLVLTPILDSDVPWLQELMKIPSVNTNTLIIPTPCPGDFAQGWVETAKMNMLSGKAYTFVVYIEEGHCPIGAIFLLINHAHSHAELGYFFDPVSWNKGYCSEASREMLQFAFRTLGLNRVFAVYFSSNPASGKVMKKVGMLYEGCRRKHIRKCDVSHDIEQYGILRDEWLQRVDSH